MSITDAPARAEHPLDTWPSRGYAGPQPWDHDSLGIPRADRDAIKSNPNKVTPTVSHAYPILTSGSAHPCVHELGRKLGELGFSNSVSEGRNPFGTVDATVLQAVRSFRSQYGVRPDPVSFGGDNPDGDRLASSHLDPWTVEGILRAHKREVQDA
jgi:hypothetical protein